jgi:hypothetical protein
VSAIKEAINNIRIDILSGFRRRIDQQEELNNQLDFKRVRSLLLLISVLFLVCQIVAVAYIVIEIQRTRISVETISVLGFETISTALFLVSGAIISLVEGAAVFFWTPLVLGILL